MVTLRPPTLAECQLVREWRNDPAVLPMLRTGYKTEAEQAAFYRDVVCNTESDHRYYAMTARVPVLCGTYHDAAGTSYGPAFGQRTEFVGLGGLTYLSRVPGEAEISLILGPAFRGKGYGVEAVGALLDEAARLDLRWVIGECLADGPRRFWWSMWYGQRWPGWTPLTASTASDQNTYGAGTFRWTWERTA
jgi:RimJ/RimL family protein N-acetyltransferase